MSRLPGIGLRGHGETKQKPVPPQRLLPESAPIKVTEEARWNHLPWLSGVPALSLLVLHAEVSDMITSTHRKSKLPFIPQTRPEWLSYRTEIKFWQNAQQAELLDWTNRYRWPRPEAKKKKQCFCLVFNFKRKKIFPRKPLWRYAPHASLVTTVS